MKKILVTGGEGRFANILKKRKSKYKFIFRNNMQKLNVLQSNLKDLYPDSNIKILNEKTNGQACTCLLGLENIDLDKRSSAYLLDKNA